MTTTLDPGANPVAPVTGDDEARRDALAERLFGALLAGIELLSVDLGRRLELYAVLHADGPATASQLAGRARIGERYAREWLEQQAVAGILDVDDAGRDAAVRRYALPAGHVPVLVDVDAPAHMMGAAPALEGMALTLPAVADAYRSGGGVSFADFGAEIRDGIGILNRPVFVNDLAGWFDRLPEARDRLEAGGAVLDLGSGVGWSSIALARAFPRARVVGVDLDRASVAEARTAAEHAGVGDRVTFREGDAASSAGTGHYDVVCVFEALHDMADPVGSLRAGRAALADGGVVLVVDERVAAAFQAPGDDVERLQYGFSVLHCLPATMDESTAVANGTVLRESTVRRWAEAAGFATVEVLPIDNDLWRFYRLDGAAPDGAGPV